MATASPFPTLFSPLKIGTMTVKNRIVMPPMVSRLGGRDGSVTERMVDYYEERARGGVGLVIVEFTCIDSSTGRIRLEQLNIDHDRFIPGLRSLARAIQRHGARAAIQIGHGGNSASSAAISHQAIAPSAIARPGYGLPREMTGEEIQALLVRLGEAAARAREAGFDGVEIHAAHRYLGQQFLSSAWNRRQDDYGGSLENRARFLLEGLESVRRAVGRDYPVWCRLNAQEEGVDDGTTQEEAALTARMAQNADADAISVTAWTEGVGWTVGYAHLPPMARPQGNLLPLVEPLRKAVSIPVMAVGRIDPFMGERVLQEGKADLICIGRGLIAAPDLPLKAAQGRAEDAVPCMACDSCRDHGLMGDPIQCAVNPAAGRERELSLQPAPHPRRVVVVGGGPGGMEAARVAALRGHRVTLMEKEARLGGQLLQAAVPPHKDGIPVLNHFLAEQMKRLGVEVVLGKAATPQEILALKPEAVIVATGVRPFVPEIRGLEGARVLQAGEVLLGRAQAGEKVVVLGGELVGCETAEVLADQGKKVTVTRRGPTMAAKVAPSARRFLLERLESKGVRLLTGVHYEEATPQGLAITREGEREVLEADTIVLAAGSQPDNSLYQSLKDHVECYLVGDAVAPRKIENAMEEGYRAALNL